MSPVRRSHADATGGGARTAIRWSAPPEHLPDDVVEALLRRAAGQARVDPTRTLALAAHLHRRGRPDEALEIATAAAQADLPEALQLCGESALTLGRPDEAIAWLERAAAMGSGAALGHLVRAAAALGDDERAMQLAEAALARSPEDHFALADTARRLLAAGRADRLNALCAELAERGARNAYLFAIQATARARQGLYDCALELADPAVVHVDCGPPAVDLPALKAEILGHPNLQRPLALQATRGGRRIDRPLIAAAPHLRRLDAGLRAPVEAYAMRIGLDAPSLGVSLQLKSWAVVMDEGTSQDWHVHPSGVLSGVYYVATSDKAAGGAGRLRFGLLPFDPTFDDSAFRLDISPRPGQLVLFPSRYAHSVVTTTTAEPRICVAFDVVRA